MKIRKTAILAATSHQHDVIFQHYLDSVYRDINTNIQQQQNPDRELVNVFNSSVKNNVISEANGEIFYSSINKLFANIVFSEQDVFVDLGSGLGKMVLQVYLQTPVKEAYGVEILQQLYQKSILAAQKVQQDTHNFNAERKLYFIFGDFLKINFETATIVFINSICFGQDILKKLSDMINKIPSIHTVISLRPIENLQHVFFKKAIHVEGSWDSALCYIYRR